MTKPNLLQRMHEIINNYEADIIQVADDNEAIEHILLEALELLVTWNVPVSNGLSKGRAIFAFSFGAGESKTPGTTNLALAANIKRIIARYNLPVFAQWEIANALSDLGVSVAFRAEPLGGYLSTKGVLEQFCTELGQRGMLTYGTAIVLVAHPEHRYRCRILVENLGLSVLIPSKSSDLEQEWKRWGCDKYGYDPLSVQKWTRNRKVFVIHEIRARLSMLRDRIISAEELK